MPSSSYGVGAAPAPYTAVPVRAPPPPPPPPPPPTTTTTTTTTTKMTTTTAYSAGAGNAVLDRELDDTEAALAATKAEVAAAVQELTATRGALKHKAALLQDMTSKINELLSMVAALLKVFMGPAASSGTDFSEVAQRALLSGVSGDGGGAGGGRRTAGAVGVPAVDDEVQSYIAERLSRLGQLVPQHRAPAADPPPDADMVKTLRRLTELTESMQEDGGW